MSKSRKLLLAILAILLGLSPCVCSYTYLRLVLNTQYFDRSYWAYRLLVPEIMRNLPVIGEASYAYDPGDGPYGMTVQARIKSDQDHERILRALTDYFGREGLMCPDSQYPRHFENSDAFITFGTAHDERGLPTATIFVTWEEKQR